MFPVDVQTYLMDEDIAIQENEAFTFNGRAFLFDYKKGEFVMKDGRMVEVTGNAAIEAWLEKLIRTEKFRFKIYDEVEYAVTLEELIGSVWPRGFVEAEIKREISEAAASNPYIEALTDWAFEREDSYMHISFTYHTVEGAFKMEVAR